MADLDHRVGGRRIALVGDDDLVRDGLGDVVTGAGGGDGHGQHGGVEGGGGGDGLGAVPVGFGHGLTGEGAGLGRLEHGGGVAGRALGDVTEVACTICLPSVVISPSGSCSESVTLWAVPVPVLATV